jgi:light-regulated signal transduction histidine kinase (bacteriophytochrome)
VRYEEQLREANAELARANADLSQLAFAASHDLQEPQRMITSDSQLFGLAISQRVVDRSGGGIWVESPAGQGATFYFTLPAFRGNGGQ